MEEIFANQGLQLIAEKICYFLTPKSFQSLILTNKFMMSYSANNFQNWFLRCQKGKLFSDERLIRWKNLVNFAQEHEMAWTLGIIFKYLHYNRNSKYSSVYHKLKNDPFKTVSFLGYVRMIKLLLEKRNIDPNCKNLLPGSSDIEEMKMYFMDCISRSISTQGTIGKTETFKAFEFILYIYHKYDKAKIKQLVPEAEKSRSTEIWKILAACLNEPNISGQTPMHMLAFRGNVKENIEVVKFTASICNNLNTEDVFGTTPMHIAAEHGHHEFVKALIPSWTNPMAKNKDNKTAVEIAEEKECHEIAKILKTRNQHKHKRITDVYMKGSRFDTCTCKSKLPN